MSRRKNRHVARREGAATLLCAVLTLGACREGSEQQGVDFIPIAPAPAGTQGCWPLAGTPATVTPVFSDAAMGPFSQLAAVAGTEVLYWTGSDGSVHELDLNGPAMDTVLVAPGVVEAAYLLPDITDAAQLSGIAVVDAQFLLVAEHASNSLLAVRRDVVDSVQGAAGARQSAGGFADGTGGAIRFHFTDPVPLLAAAGGVVFVGDTQNNAVRQVILGGVPSALTVAGSGAPGAGSGDLTQTRFDTPSGMATGCSGDLLLVESGAEGAAGNRLISLAVGGASIFGGFDGASFPLAGDGTPATTQGVDQNARLGTPRGLVTTAGLEAYWVDALDGVLRRHDFGTGVSDCPLFADCATAVTAGGSFTGTSFSVAIGDSGAIYVLEGDTGTLYRVAP